MANRNSGLTSARELFAMKKNMAYEAKFTHSLDAMTKDYTNRKENIKQEIRSVYNELQEVKTSTGYSLKQARSAHPKNSPYRNPNVPKIYLPPIGVRLVKKYVGVDVKRQSLSEVSYSTDKRRSLGDVLNGAFGLGEPVANGSKVKVSIREESSLCDKSVNELTVEDCIDINKEVSIYEIHEKENCDIDQTEDEKLEIRNDVADDDDDDFFQTNIHNLTKLQDYPRPLIVVHDTEKDGNFESLKRNDSDIDIREHSTDILDNTLDDRLDVDARANSERKYRLQERRSSRSTFRPRNSARLHVKPSHLSEHNLTVAGINQETNDKKKGHPVVKQPPQHFYLDYGDGKLHDIMEIPKFKDCSRPWCNPHCKTCINRARSRPCFVLIRADENIRKRLIPQDKRRLSMFTKLNVSQSIADEVAADENQTENTEVRDKSVSVMNVGFKDNVEFSHTKIAVDTECTPKDNTVVSDADGNIDEESGNDLPNEKTNHNWPKTPRKKGFNMKRIGELAVPRGGPPAEVRFSKTSLRRTQERLREDERTKALTEYERRNLTYIQGKISVFLALMNEQEISTRKPRHTETHPHVRKSDIKLSTSKLTMKSRKKEVRFSPRASYRVR